MEKKGSFSSKTGIIIAGYAALIGSFNIIFGLLEMVNGLGLTNFYSIPSDVVGGLMLIFIGSIFLRGIGELSQAKISGIAYLLVGVMMTIAYNGLNILIFGAEGIEFLLGKEEFSNWSWQYSFRSEIWLLSVLIIPALLFLHSHKKTISPY